MDKYVFKSDAVKSLLPVGAATSAHITREEAIGYLGLVQKAAEKQGRADYDTVVYSALNYGNGWDVNTVANRVAYLLDDIKILQKLAEAPTAQGA